MRSKDEFVAESGIPERTLRHYEQNGIMPLPLDAHGEWVGYGDTHMHVAAAIHCLKHDGVRRLRDLRARITSMTPEELAGYTFDGQEGDEGEEYEEEEGDGGARPVAAPSPGLPASLGDAWLRYTLLPGLELHVLQGAGQDVEKAAEEIRARFGGSG